jgi:hypothetical protein
MLVLPLTLQFKRWTLNPLGDGIGGGAFGRSLGHEGGALLSGIYAQRPT